MHLFNELKKGVACDSVGKPHSALGRAVCLSVHPGKMLLFPFIRHFNKHYKNKYAFARLVFGFDLLLLGALFGLGCAFLFIHFHSPARFADKIIFDSSIAPREIIAGAPSTLVIRITNGTNEILRSANLALEYPNHFLLQELALDEVNVRTKTISLGDVPVGGNKTVHIRGVMFGDVGGEQTFTSVLDFVHGKKQNVAGRKTDTFVFSPTASTLKLSLELPGVLMAFQPITGTIAYHNTGEIDFPTISVQPEWPSAFSLTQSSTLLVDGEFKLPAIKAGEKGLMEFSGFLGDVGEKISFVFHPSFTFNKTKYKQETLTHVAPVVPSQIKIEHSAAKNTLIPGTEAGFTISYENIGEFAITDLSLGIESDSPFFKKEKYEIDRTRYPKLAIINPGEFGEVEIRVPLRTSIMQSETSVYENLNLTTRATANYTLGDGSGQKVTSRSPAVSWPVTSPVTLESFGRYYAASGDQLGRGPLPPRVGIETKYWVFWHIDNTTNDLADVKIEGKLAPCVRFTGRQTASQNNGVEFDETLGIVVWKTQIVKPTFPPTSNIVGIAFELGITPNADMVTTSPMLIDQILLTATDARTSALVSASGKEIGTELPHDAMSLGKEKVEK
jgi:hypothetical protein